MTASRQLDFHVSRFHAGAMAPHSHDRPWFCVVLRGTYEETILHRSGTHGPGHMLFCPPGISHSQRFGKAGTTKFLFRPDRLTLDYLTDGGVALDGAPFAASSDLLSIVPRLLREIAQPDLHSDLAAQGLILELIAAFARSRDERLTSPAPAWLRRVREALDDSGRAYVGLQELAKEADRHPVHLAKSFRAHFGETIGGYLRRRRALRASDLLRATSLPLTQIALDCGYGSSAQFSRSFRAVTGLTPSQYRDQR